MTKAKCDILITCEELLPSCKEILNRLPKTPRRIFSINTSNTQLPNFEGEIKCLPQLYQEGSELPELEQLRPRDAHTTVAFYLTTSGTSGPQVQQESSPVSMWLRLIRLETRHNYAC